MEKELPQEEFLSNLKRYPTDEHMQDGDIVINSTGTGTLGRVGIYRNTDNTTGLLIVPDSHVTVIHSFSCISSHYLYAFMKAHQTELERKAKDQPTKGIKATYIKRNAHRSSSVI